MKTPGAESGDNTDRNKKLEKKGTFNLEKNIMKSTSDQKPTNRLKINEEIKHN